MGENKKLPENPPERMNMTSLSSKSILFHCLWTSLKKNNIDPMVCYEVAHELELSLTENCRSKGFHDADIEVHKLIAEMNWKTREK